MSATFSPCGRYRYTLMRPVSAELGRLTLVMLNPSTADADHDDPTIRRCLGLARRLAVGELVVVNLYALRSTDPAALLADPDPVGPENDSVLRQVLAGAGFIGPGFVVAAWGAHRAVAEERVQLVLDLAGDRLMCLGVTKSGAPRHPLYLPADAPLVPWPAAEVHGL